MTDNNSFRVIERKEYQEVHIQLIPRKGEPPVNFSKRIAEIVHRYNAKIIRATFFGKLTEEKNEITRLSDVFHGIDFPYSWIEGADCSDSFINGVYMFAVSGVEVKRLVEQGRVIGSFFQTAKAEFCYLGGLCPDPELSRGQQTSSLLDRAGKYLNEVGLSFPHTIRTWYYLDHILDWYDEFNHARTAFFKQHDIFNKLVPASTGIGGKNNSGSQICLELNAVRPKSDDFSVSEVISPLQGPAENYGSAFSRAVSYSEREYSALTISGTAGINREGETMFPGNILKQIESTFEVIQAILESREFEFSDVVRSYVYVKEKNFCKDFLDYVRSGNFEKFAFICSENAICRDGLLFEIELDAIKKLN